MGFDTIPPTKLIAGVSPPLKSSILEKNGKVYLDSTCTVRVGSSCCKMILSKQLFVDLEYFGKTTCCCAKCSSVSSYSCLRWLRILAITRMYTSSRKAETRRQQSHKSHRKSEAHNLLCTLSPKGTISEVEKEMDIKTTGNQCLFFYWVCLRA